MDDLLQEFLTETNDNLDIIDIELVKFEKDPNNAEILGNIFRLVHTIKGTSGFLGLPRLGAIAHAAETLMDKFREGAKVTPAAVDLVMKSIDRIKALVQELENSGGQEPEGDDSDLITQLDKMSENAFSLAVEEPPPPPPPPPSAGVSSTVSQSELDELERAFRETEVEFPVKRKKSEPKQEIKKQEAPQEARKEEPTSNVAVPVPQAPAAQAPATLASSESAGANQAVESAAGAKGGVSGQSIRVNVDTLEQLMTMVSELVLTRNQLLDIVRRQEDSEFKVPLQRLSQVTGELQEAVMKTRMQPIGNAWQKLPRIIRDLSRDLGKPIDLEMVGADTELDRQVLEIIKDPLTHMIRNSADHGLEYPADRLAVGKPENGVIRLSAYHEGGHIIIEVSDDGRGLNTIRIREKIIKNGLASEAEVDKMSDAQIHAFIFHAGFSTAEAVTSVSGRGVGMDVVRTNIELIGGSVNVVSRPGRGTTFFIKIPLTLAIVSALIVMIGEERFAIPQLSVVELVRVQKEGEHRIERVKDAAVLRLRDKLLPIVYLDSLLGIDDDSRKSEECFVVIMQVGNRVFGIGVDSVVHTEEIVVKPVSAILRHVSMFSGTTILGDGSVIMIVDPNNVAQAMATSDVLSHSGRGKEIEFDQHTLEDERVTLLIFRAGTQEPKAVPLSLVTRLEVFDVEKIERLSGRDLVQYRGSLMALVYMNEESRHSESRERPMLVFTDGGKATGLVVDEIIDIVEEAINIELESDLPGIIGTAIIKGRATEILDIGHYLPTEFRGVTGPKKADTSRQKILFVDDSAFFRNMLAPILQSEGYEVTVCDGGRAALERLEKDGDFNIVITDIDMPDIDGFALVSQLRAKEQTRNLPVIALSGLCTPEAIERGKQVGFTDYIAKFDKPSLLSALDEFLHENHGVNS